MRFSYHLWVPFAAALTACGGHVFVDTSAGDTSAGDTSAGDTSAGDAGRGGANGSTSSSNNGGANPVTTGSAGSSNNGGANPVTTGSAGTGGAGPCLDIQSDPYHCGACGHDCQGGACEAGACQPVVVACDQRPKAVTVDATHVYWLNDPGVSKAPKHGGPVTVLVTEPYAGNGWGIAVDDANVYWPGYNGVQSVAKGGGAPKVLSPIEAYDVAVDDTSVYFTYPDVHRVAKSGGPESLLASSGDSVTVAVDNGYVYWSAWTTGFVQRVPVSGGAVADVASGIDYPNDVAVHDGFVYFSTGYGELLKSAADGSQTVLLTSDYFAYGVDVDDSGVYFATFDNGKIAMIPSGQTGVKILAEGQFYPRSVAVDETTVYWTNDYGIGDLQGCVMKVAKPAP